MKYKESAFLYLAKWIAPAVVFLVQGKEVRGEVYEPAGVNVTVDADWQKDVAEIRRGNFSAIRLSILWNEIERIKGKYDFSVYDPVVQHARSLGLDVLALLTGSNLLYGGDERAEAFARFAGRVAERYRWLIYGYEVFENVDEGGGPIGGISFSQPLAVSYGRTFLLAYQAIRAFDPLAKVYVGGVSGEDEVFLETLQARGVLSFADGISLVIPFSSSTYWDYSTYLRTYRVVDYIRRLVGSKKDVVVGRLGVVGYMRSGEERASAMARLAVSLTAMGVDRWFVDPLHNRDENSMDGLLPPEGLPRPVYVMFLSMNSFLAGMKPVYPPFSYQILYPGMAMEGSGSYFFLNGGVGAIVFWSTGAKDTGILVARAPGFVPVALVDPALASDVQFTLQKTAEGWYIQNLPPRSYPLILMMKSQDLVNLFPEMSPQPPPEVIRISPLPTPSGSSTGEGRAGS